MFFNMIVNYAGKGVSIQVAVFPVHTKLLELVKTKTE